MRGKPFYDEPAITSSDFTYVASDGTEYPLSYIRDDNYGKLVVYSIINNAFTVLNDNIGTVDYKTGRVVINNLKVSNYNNYISIYMLPKNKDVIVSLNKIALIDLNDVTVNVVSTQKQ